MKKLLYFITLSFMNLGINAQTDNAASQEAERKKLMDASMKTEDKAGWFSKGGLGLDLGQLMNINPYLGAGSNRIGFGGAIAYKAILKKGSLSWNNNFGLNYSTQRIGSGTLNVGSSKKLPFEKALDILTLSSNVAYKVNSTSHWEYSTDLFFQSQFSKSFLDSISKKIYLKGINDGTYRTNLVSKFFAPANISLAVGMKYHKQDNWYVFLSPIALKTIIITDQKIANLGFHGTKLKDGSSTEYRKSATGVGALVRGGYTTKIWNRLNYSSDLLLYSDYLNHPENVDVTWINDIGIEIVKGFNLNFKLDAFYDNDKFNNITDNNAPGGVSGVGKRTNWIQQIILVYNRNF